MGYCAEVGGQARGQLAGTDDANYGLGVQVDFAPRSMRRFAGVEAICIGVDKGVARAVMNDEANKGGGDRSGASRNDAWSGRLGGLPEDGASRMRCAWARLSVLCCRVCRLESEIIQLPPQRMLSGRR